MGQQDEKQARQAHMLMDERRGRVYAQKMIKRLHGGKRLPAVHVLHKALIGYEGIAAALCVMEDGTWQVRSPSAITSDVKYYSFVPVVESKARQANELLEMLRAQIAERSLSDE